MRYAQVGGDEKISRVRENLDHQMQTPNDKKNATAKTKGTQPSLYGWWTWIDAIQMAMPVYMQMYRLTGETKYRDHAMAMYRWSRNECGGGLFNTTDGLWWRDADYVPPYKEPDGKDCYWSRGNGWVYAALVRCMDELSPKDKAYKELKKDFLLMSKGLLKCQREDGFWNPSLVSSNYAMPETSGTALFLYGMARAFKTASLRPRTTVLPAIAPGRRWSARASIPTASSAGCRAPAKTLRQASRSATTACPTSKTTAPAVSCSAPQRIINC